MRKAVFLDKDGTLVHDVPYNVDPQRIRLCEGVPEALARLKAEGYLLVMISNQAGVARGYFEEQALEGVKETLQRALQPYKAGLDAFYYCPHHPEGIVPVYTQACACRKPQPGMLLQAAKDLGIDLAASWMIGDILHDVEAGNKAGCRTILIDNGNETEWVMNPDREPTHVVKAFKEVVSCILQEAKQTAK
ncbi:D,D-heptose 1,7-bisphosphate phosphatase [Pontibacter ummariensis]|uniref:D,D-heptose 1,7-bisphosphate phosphatase n=1 Tax=Pontibacter ummariensis TaxID=1610492 RepID=A0A239FFF6_9BACT|nr:HAD family hydrolase [Pontibacter ummariensis]PRY12283.1 D,D-heptose 1,7-bisphosphate phosphatase [Pontibacter ummariensis]SNS55501.1 D,D-heptose 1,7-bisphosphate phosphatase [Pontibacter ummariensis]